MRKNKSKRKEDIIVRNATRKDLLGYCEIWVGGYDETKADSSFGDRALLKRPTPKMQKENFYTIFEELRKNRAIFVIARQKGKVVGYCHVRPLNTPPSETLHVGVLGMRVRKGARGKGIGTEMIKNALNKSKKKFEIIELSVMATNVLAKKLYWRFGFKTWGIAPMELKRKGKYIDREHMYLKL
jgi:ribosomal protein S18 acetylase RimI-like enzyme